MDELAILVSVAHADPRQPLEQFVDRGAFHAKAGIAQARKRRVAIADRLEVNVAPAQAPG